MVQREQCNRLVQSYHTKYLMDSKPALMTHNRNSSDPSLLQMDGPREHKMVRSMTTTQLNDSATKINTSTMQEEHLQLCLAICELFKRIASLYLNIMDLEVTHCFLLLL
jgi:hypothetical protein